MSNDVMKILGERLQEARGKMGISITGMKKRCGFKSHASINNYENGNYQCTSQTIAKLIWLAGFYEISADELFKDLLIDEKLIDKAKEKYDMYIERMIDARNIREENQAKKISIALRKNKKRKADKIMHDFAVCIHKGGQLMWFVKSKMMKHDYTNETTRVNIFDRDIDKAMTFETIADASLFTRMDGMEVVRWRDYEAEKIKKFDEE